MHSLFWPSYIPVAFNGACLGVLCWDFLGRCEQRSAQMVLITPKFNLEKQWIWGLWDQRWLKGSSINKQSPCLDTDSQKLPSQSSLWFAESWQFGEPPFSAVYSLQPWSRSGEVWIVYVSGTHWDLWVISWILRSVSVALLFPNAATLHTVLDVVIPQP